MNYVTAKNADCEFSSLSGNRFSLKDGSMVFAPLLFYAFFCQSLASASVVLYVCLAVSFIALVMHFLANGKFANKKFGLELAWVPFFVLYYAHCFVFGVNSVTLCVVYAILFLCMYATSGEKSWIASCLKILIVFAAFHAFCTVLFWLVPALYEPVKAAFFSASYMAKDYRSGFTAHYSCNSIYLSLGFVCWVCGLIGAKSKLRAADIILASIFFFALFLTTKRGPLIASLVAIAVCYLYSNKEKFTGTALKALLVVVIAVLGVVMLAAIVPGADSTLERFVELSEDETGNGRSYLYEYAWGMFCASPVFGNGWGAYSKLVATTSLGSMYADLGFSSMSAHNVYLQLLAETGIVGLAIFVVSAMATLVVSMRRAHFHRTTGAFGESFCLWACFGIQIFFLIYCFSGNPLYDPQCYIPYFISCVAVFAICSLDAKRNNEKR